MYVCMHTEMPCLGANVHQHDLARINYVKGYENRGEALKSLGFPLGEDLKVGYMGH